MQMNSKFWQNTLFRSHTSYFLVLPSLTNHDKCKRKHDDPIRIRLTSVWLYRAQEILKQVSSAGKKCNPFQPLEDPRFFIMNANTHPTSWDAIGKCSYYTVKQNVVFCMMFLWRFLVDRKWYIPVYVDWTSSWPQLASPSVWSSNHWTSWHWNGKY